MEQEKKEYIELNTFLKIKGLAKSGGEAKQIIRSETVKVNGEIETRNKNKLLSGYIVKYDGKEYLVSDIDIKKP